MSAEIASRNLSDGGRYNMLPKVAEVMGYDFNNRQLWKDKALIELNLAVLYSYDKKKVSIVDHHSATESFMIHMKKEAAKQRHVPGVRRSTAVLMKKRLTATILYRIGYGLFPQFQAE